jgi:hypothetical protein
MQSRRGVAGVVVALVTGLVSGSAVAGTHDEAPAGAVASASGEGSAFEHPGRNVYFPLVPGTVSRYRGTEDGERFRETVTVTRRHKTIQGVRTTVVLDVLRRVDGTLAERTEDWYATDELGNVWYFGEDTATYDSHGGLESREGSWQSGVDGGRRGIIMPASPHPTNAYRQEFDRGTAEDQAWIVQRHVRVTVPFGVVTEGLRSFEWTRLEPNVLSAKIYAPGLGIVRERDVAGGDESFELVSVVRR